LVEQVYPDLTLALPALLFDQIRPLTITTQLKVSGCVRTAYPNREGRRNGEVPSIRKS